MNGTGTIIVVLGVGAAAFLYFKSRSDQAAALAAAAAAPGPGLVGKIENTLGKVFNATTARAVGNAITGIPSTGYHAATSFTSGVAGTAAGVVSSLSHIF